MTQRPGFNASGVQEILQQNRKRNERTPPQRKLTSQAIRDYSEIVVTSNRTATWQNALEHLPVEDIRKLLRDTRMMTQNEKYTECLERTITTRNASKSLSYALREFGYDHSLREAHKNALALIKTYIADTLGIFEHSAYSNYHGLFSTLKRAEERLNKEPPSVSDKVDDDSSHLVGNHFPTFY